MSSILFRHYKGGLYVFVDYATDEATGDECIIYQSCETGKKWIRTIESMKMKVTLEDGSVVPRFFNIEGVKIS